MEKRSFWMLGASLLVITLFYMLLPPPTQNKQEKVSPVADLANTPPAKTPPAAHGVAALPPPPPAGIKQTGGLVVVETPLYRAVMETGGGRLASLKLKNYQAEKTNTSWGHVVPALNKFLPGDVVNEKPRMELVKNELGYIPMLGIVFEGNQPLTDEISRTVFTAQGEGLKDGKMELGNGPGTVVLTGKTTGGLVVRKTLTFYPDTYILGYQLQVINYSGTPRGIRVENLWGEGPAHSSADSEARAHLGGVWRMEGSVHSETAKDMEQPVLVTNPDWAGFGSNYFITVARNETPIQNAFYRGVQITDKAGESTWVGYYGMSLPPVELESEKQIITRYKLYMGPKETDELEKFGNRLEESLDLSLKALSMPLLAMLQWFYGLAGNWGVAIILLTLVVRVVLFPLTYKGMVSMKRLQKLQPKVTALKERLKNDKDKFGKELMGLYRKHKVNPLNGCLPMLLQIPIFFALYSALMGAIELRHTEFFGWITDLSAKDGLYILPVLMGASMFFQQKMSPPPADALQAKMFQFLPLILTVFMLNFPSGLVLYWTVSNLLSILQQVVINRAHIPEPQD